MALTNDEKRNGIAWHGLKKRTAASQARDGSFDWLLMRWRDLH
jgi:hypothetical protein